MKSKIRDIIEKIRIKLIAKKAGSSIEKPLKIVNSSHIKLGRDVRIKSGARIECYDHFSGNRFSPQLTIKDGVIIGYRFSCLVADSVTIGENTILASDIMITSENHGIDPMIDIPYHKQPLSTKPVKIGKGCWIGEKAVILPGVTIGDKCVVAAGAVVTKTIPDCCIVAGTPAKIIKKYDFERQEWLKV